MAIFDQDDPESIGHTLERTRAHCGQFIGLNESEAVALASKLKLKLRVVRDDKTRLTMDGRPGRVTVDLRSGRVTRAKAG